LLLAQGADVNAKTSTSATALIMASQNGHLEIVRALLANGADINARTSDANNPLSALDYAMRGRHDDIRALLLRAGAKQ
jgi:serine/threonine-protein phosphatase 6 regulatory ankyrin repeat subunit B